MRPSSPARRTRRGGLSRRRRRLGQAVGDLVGLLLGGRLDHHAHQLLGARGAEQHAPGVAELLLDGVDRLGDLVALGDGQPVGDGHVHQDLRQPLDHRGELGQRGARWRSCATSARRPVSRPSPVVAWSRKTRCPLCSPPRLRSRGPQRLQDVAVADGGRLHRDAGVAHGVVEAEVAHHRGDDGVLLEAAALVQRQRADGEDRVAVDDARRRRSPPGTGRRRRRARCRCRRRARATASISGPRWVEPMPSLMFQPSGSLPIAWTVAPARR